MKPYSSKQKEEFQEAVKAIGLILPEHHKVVCDYIFELERQVEQLYLSQCTLQADFREAQNAIINLNKSIRLIQNAFRDAGNYRI